MNKANITVATVGHMPPDFDKQKILNWKSEVFTVVGDIHSYTLPTDSDGLNWQFTDNNLESVLPQQFSSDFLIAIVNVPLEDNWYSRRLKNNRVVFTAHEIKDILQFSNIPFENAIYRALYAYTLYYKRNSNKIPLLNEKNTGFTHDETRGCLFDMNGTKTDIYHSCDSPIICQDCIEALKNDRISNEFISKIQKEIKRIKKPLYYRVLSFIKKRPILSLIISLTTALMIGMLGSLIASYIFEILLKKV